MAHPQDINLAWYCLKTMPKKEHIAANLMRREVDVKTFCPQISFLKKTKRGKVRFIEALFPGYLFARCNLNDKYRHLLAIKGVSGVVRYGDYFPQVPDDFILDLETQLGDEEIIKVPSASLEIGKKGVVTEGPFKDFEAVIKGLIPAQERVRLLLNFLGQERTIEISVDSFMTKEQIESPKAFLSKNCC